MEITKTNLKKFRQELEKSLAVLEEKFELKIKQGNIRFDEVSFSMKMDFRNEDAKSQIEIDLANHYGINDYDLTKKDYEGFKLFGYNRRSSKYPFIVKNQNGRMLKVDLKYVAKWFVK